MPPEAVLDFVKWMNAEGIEIIIDGGWAVDALVGNQTRVHDDLDIAVYHKDVPRIRTLLEGRGYVEVPRGDSWECNFVYGNDQGHLIDIHSCSFDADGNHTYGVPYSLDAFSGKGSILEEPVRCIPPKILMEYHTGYPLDENDYHDVKQLARKFGLEIPDEYNEFLENDQET